MITHFCVFCVSIDSPLGKIDKHLLSQQTLMELLIKNFKYSMWVNGGTAANTDGPRDLSEWNDVGLNGMNEVITIEWQYIKLGGSIDLNWLPLSTEKVNLMSNEFTGTADMTCLPACLEYLNLSYNRFSGTIDLTRLPVVMKKLLLFSNGFYGLTDFTQLPKSLTELDISDTMLEGEIFELDRKLYFHNTYVKDMRNS